MNMQSGRVFWPGWETGPIIGRGSFGEVYEIHRDVFGTLEQAALKVITIPQRDSDIDAMYSEGYDNGSITSTFQGKLEKLVQEYTMMRSMSNCPNIVRCDDVRYIQHDDGIGWDIFIKMELLTPLTKAVTKDIPEETVIQVGMDICRALERCAQQQIIHRDVKPQNILLSADGIYKLGDFGIAKAVERTAYGTISGSYNYMAPEVNFYQPYGSTVDIYSLGLVLYWMLNERRMPFSPLPPVKLTEKMEGECLTRRMQGESLPPPAHGSERLKAIVLKACAYHPADRYASATEMLNALQAMSKPQLKSAPEPIPEPAPTPDPEPRDDIWVKKPPVAVPLEEDLDVRQTLRFAYEENPAGKAINVQVGNETVQVWIPEQFENGQTFYYEGMGLKSAHSEKRGDLYLTVNVNPKAIPSQPAPQPKSSESSKIWMILTAAIVIVLIVVGVWKSGSQRNNSHTPERDTNTSMQQNNTHEHIWTGATCIKPKTCNTCGVTEGTALGHDWKEATYHSPKTCKRCGQTEGEPLATEESMKDTPLTATVTSTMTPNRTKIACAAIEASSYLKYNTIQCPPNRVLDGRIDTSWQEGANGWGINEWIRMSFNKNYAVKYISVQMGFWATDNAYWENGRPAAIRLDFSDGSSVVCTIPDQMKEYEIRLSKAVQTNWVRITILSVYEGTMYEDTCISEIEVYS